MTECCHGLGESFMHVVCIRHMLENQGFKCADVWHDNFALFFFGHP